MLITMQTNNLDGRVALITGASRDGKAMALALGGAGAKLALVARDKQKLDETAAEAAAVGAESAVFVTDVTEESQVAALATEVAARFGHVDIPINNAGTNVRKTIVEYSLAEWRKVMDTNLTSVFLMCRAFIDMRGRGYGRIINMTSIMSHVSLPGLCDLFGEQGRAAWVDESSRPGTGARRHHGDWHQSRTVRHGDEYSADE